MKRARTLFLAAALVLAILASASVPAFAQTPDFDPDTSQPVTLRFLMLGNNEQADHQLVWDEINKLSQAELNVTIQTDVLSLADYETRYPLILASGEAYDLIYTSAWAHYFNVAPKGAFHEITWDLIKKYMPLTYANQPEEYMNHNRLGDGKVYVVPQNYVNLSGFAITIREDIRKELGVPEVTDLATLEGYLTAVSENKPGIFPYAATIDNQPLKTVLFNSGNNIISLNGNPMEMLFSFKYTEGMTPQEAMDQVVFVGKMPEYREWAVRMKDWAGKGFWSRSAIADTVQVRDSFENGQSAMFVQNTGTLGVANMTLRGKNLEPMMIDIFPDAYRFLGLSNAGIAVPSVSKNLGRALMWLDKLKNDQRYYELYRFGIEGEHWIDLGNRMWEPGPKQDRYVYGDGSWGFQSVLFERDRIGNDPQSLEIWRRWRAENEQPNPLVGFNFDIAPVQNEIAALTNVRAEHMYLIDLGLVDDVDAAIEAMNKAALAAGIDRVMEELKKQMADYVAHNQ